MGSNIKKLKESRIFKERIAILKFNMEVKDGQSTYHKFPGEGDFYLDQLVGFAVRRRI
jgi:hypothetical protein